MKVEGFQKVYEMTISMPTKWVSSKPTCAGQGTTQLLNRCKTHGCILDSLLRETAPVQPDHVTPNSTGRQSQYCRTSTAWPWVVPSIPPTSVIHFPRASHRANCQILACAASTLFHFQNPVTQYLSPLMNWKIFASVWSNCDHPGTVALTTAKNTISQKTKARLDCPNFINLKSKISMNYLIMKKSKLDLSKCSSMAYRGSLYL